jgi:hypothetical protein
VKAEREVPTAAATEQKRGRKNDRRISQKKARE